MSRRGDFLRSGEATVFAFLGAAATVACWMAVCGFANWRHQRRKALIFWLVSIALRLAIFPVHPGDDLWRYQWEGRIQLHGFNPYAVAPDAPVLAALRDAGWEGINHRDHAAIYPPLAEAAFAGMERLGFGVNGYKCVFLLADLGVVFILRRLLAIRGRSIDLAAWYAWNPLAIYAATGAAHFDVLMVGCLLSAIWLLELTQAQDAEKSAGETRRAWLPMASAIVFGMSIALKAVPLAMTPGWFFAVGWRRAVWTLPLALAVSPVIALFYGFPQTPVFAGLSNFARDFRVNDAIWWLAYSQSRQNFLYPWVLLAVCGGLAVWFRDDWRRGLLWVMGAALILSPVLHAWYVVWILPLAAWRAPSAWPWFVFSGSIFGYFLLWEVNHASGRPWEEPLWLRMSIFLPPLIALGWDALARQRAPEAEAW